MGGGGGSGLPTSVGHLSQIGPGGRWGGGGAGGSRTYNCRILLGGTGVGGVLVSIR